MSPETHRAAKALFLELLDADPIRRARELVDVDPVVREAVLTLFNHHTSAPLIEEPDTIIERQRDPLGLVGESEHGFQILDFVAEGGFGYVYRARQEPLGRAVALKIYKDDKAVPERSELQVLSRLSQEVEGVVPCFGTGQLSAGHFAYFEWVEGRTLEEALAASNTPWALERVLAVLAAAADALAHAHARGVAHRDLKPSNIFLAENDTTSKLIDFGTAKLAGEHGFHATRGSLAAITPDYAAPEQLVRKIGATGPWTDVYALALVCTRLLLGRPLFDSLAHVLATCEPDHRPTPRALSIPLNPKQHQVFELALALEPRARYPDAAQFWHALGRSV